MSLANMQKALKCANNDDSCMIKYDDNETDNITFTFTDPKSFKTQVCIVLYMLKQLLIGCHCQTYGY